MITYVGYGFDTNEIDDSVWYALAQKYDGEEIAEHFNNNYAEEIANGTIIPEDDRIQDTLDFIDENNIDRCEYLRNIINSEESEKAGTNYIVSSYNNYLVFDSIRFADDSKRAKYIRTQEDFINMIAKYVPIKDIKFGNIYEGTDWIDPNFFID